VLVGKRFTGGEIISKNFRSIQEARKWIFGDAQKLKANPGSLFSIRAASGRVATAQVEGRYGVSEGATDVFEVTPMPPRDSAHCCYGAVRFYKSLGFEVLGTAAQRAHGQTMDDSDIILRRML